MASLDFFAVYEDQVSLFQFLLQQTDVQIFEFSSQPNRRIRSFTTVDDINDTVQLGHDKPGNGLGALFTLYSPSVMPEVAVRRIEFKVRRDAAAQWREELFGGALMQLYLGGVHETVITKSHFGHNSQRRAATWGVEDGVDWSALSKLSGRVQRHIRKLAVEKMPGRPVLSAATRLWRSGYALKEAARSPFHWTHEGLAPDA
jgi:hypothetical protein